MDALFSFININPKFFLLTVHCPIFIREIKGVVSATTIIL